VWLPETCGSEKDKEMTSVANRISKKKPLNFPRKKRTKFTFQYSSNKESDVLTHESEKRLKIFQQASTIMIST
jgi:hypothetical protein